MYEVTQCMSVFNLLVNFVEYINVSTMTIRILSLGAELPVYVRVCMPLDNIHSMCIVRGWSNREIDVHGGTKSIPGPRYVSSRRAGCG